MERDNNYNETNRLQELGGSDFEIADGQPNIKGWTIKNPQGQTIGEVDELIFDVQSRKVRYMVVDLEDSVLDLEPRDVLVPIGLAELNEDDDDVILPNVTVEQLRALPAYEKNRIDRDTETSIRSIFGGLGAAAGATGAAMGGAAYRTGDALTGDATTGDRNDDFYDHNHFNDRGLYRNRRDELTDTDTDYTAANTHRDLTDGDTRIPIIEENVEIGKREVETGGARISSRIVEEEVEENITLREEHVNVERNPVNRPATDADLNAFREGEIKLTEHAEVPVVNKEARVVEEITLDKEVTERDEVIRDTVRKTEVDVENLDANTDRPRTDTDTYLTDEERDRNRPTNL
jgi:stress response protein YsnF